MNKDQRICRFCHDIEVDEEFSSFSEKNENLENFEFITNVMFQELPLLPSLICQSCQTKLDTCSAFKQQLLESAWMEHEQKSEDFVMMSDFLSTDINIQVVKEEKPMDVYSSINSIIIPNFQDNQLGNGSTSSGSSDNPSIPCVHCKKLIKKKGMASHVRRIHVNVERRPCPHCEKKLKSNYLNIHIKRIHPIYSCGKCSFTTRSMEEMDYHAKFHCINTDPPAAKRMKMQ